MPIQASIVDESSGSGASVSQSNALRVVVIPRIPSDLTEEEIRARRILYTALEDSAGSSDLTIDGSTTPTDFYLDADPRAVTCINECRIILHGGDLIINTNDSRAFGTAGVLTNGLRFYVTQGGEETEIFDPTVTVIGDFYRYATEPIVSDQDAISTGVDYFHVEIKFPTQICIPPGSTDRLTMHVSDDLSSLTLFEVKLDGYRIFPETP